MYRIVLALIVPLFCSCAYRMGAPERQVPGGYQSVSIPVFKNETMEPGLEVYFTNSIIQEFERSRVARVTSSNQAEAVVEGRIEQISISPGSKIQPDQSDNDYQPMGTVLSVDYRMVIRARVAIIDRKANKEIWSGRFSGERAYNASQVTLPGLNTVNPNYNLSVKQQAAQTLAGEMMSEAFDRITENF